MSTWNRYIKDFVSYLKIEKGLAENSIFAYQKDVDKLFQYAMAIHKNAEDITYNDLKHFIATLYDLGLSARSQARIISGIKQFYGFLGFLILTMTIFYGCMFLNGLALLKKT
jgi:integrase/recombinase XerD